MRVATLALALLLFAPVSASGTEPSAAFRDSLTAPAPFGELPFQIAPGGATCLRATGAPGELVAWAPDGARFVRATSSGLTAAGDVRLGPPPNCPVAAAQPNGAGVVASVVVTKQAIDLAVAVREPGAAWGTPIVVRQAKNTVLYGLAAAVSEHGDAVVVWRELRGSGRDVATRIRAIRRRAGRGFGAPETVADAGTLDFNGGIAVGIGADGGAVALWSQTFRAGDRGRTSAAAAIAAPGAPFAAPARLTEKLEGPPGLAVAPDGRALAVVQSDGRTGVAERAPGGAFGAVERVGPGGFAFNAPAVVLRDDGAALIAWGEDAETGITAVRRPGLGAFGPPIQVAGSDFGTGAFNSGSESILIGTDGTLVPSPPSDRAGGALRAVLAPDGTAMLTWAAERSRGGISWNAPQVDTLSADGTIAKQVLGGPLLDADTVAPVMLDNGAPAVAWGDNASSLSGDGRLHLAAEGAADAPQPAFPRVTVGSPERTVLRAKQPLVLPVTCSDACDVRASAHGQVATASLTRAGRARLVFGTRSIGVAPLRAARVRVTVASGPPGARIVQTQVVRPRLRRIPEPPMPHILGLVARRSGSTIDVRWRTDRGTAGVEFIVVGTSSRGGNDEGSLYESARGGGRHRFHVRLRKAPASTRYVQVLAFRDSDGHMRRAIARIR